ncbi:hypothetical protein ABW21_db0200682 [Orbilia brochopaga]|nr:hypothetical protein ABW21_db0200682 [Drechslerella brochopaga]
MGKKRALVFRIAAIEGKDVVISLSRDLTLWIKSAWTADGRPFIKLEVPMPTQAKRDNVAAILILGSVDGADCRTREVSGDRKVDLELELKFGRVIIDGLCPPTDRTDKKPEYSIFDYISKKHEGYTLDVTPLTHIRIQCWKDPDLVKVATNFDVPKPFHPDAPIPDGNFQTSFSYRTLWRDAVKAEYNDMKTVLLKTCEDMYDMEAQFQPLSISIPDTYRVQLRFPDSRQLSNELQVRAGSQFCLQWGSAIKLGRGYFTNVIKGTVTFVDEEILARSANIILSMVLVIPAERFPREGSRFSIKPSPNKVTYIRKKVALKILDHQAESSSPAGQIYRTIFSGAPTAATRLSREHRLKISRYLDTTNLDPSQMAAARLAVTNQLSAIQGPPGTGKTHVIIQLIKAFLAAGDKLLVSAPSNQATNLLASRLWEEFGNNETQRNRMIRFVSETYYRLRSLTTPAEKEQKASDSDDETEGDDDDDAETTSKVQIILEQEGTKGRFPNQMSMDYHRKSLDVTYEAALQDFLSDRLTKEDRLVFLDLRDTLDREILDKANVVFSTCTAAGSHQIRLFYKAQVVVVDEAGQCSEPETLIPLTSCSRSLEMATIVGDHDQLPPISNRVAILRFSMMERMARMVDRGIMNLPMDMLKYNYRSLPPIVHYFSRETYDNKVV